MPQDRLSSSALQKQIDDGENNAPLYGMRLSRSPQPYRRRQLELRDSMQKNLYSYSTEARLISTAVGHLDSGTARHGTTWFPPTIGGTQTRSPNSSDSGTEADDESNHVLRGLPAPPLRLRKGLKEDTNQGSFSPLLTPTYLDDQHRKLSLDCQTRQREGQVVSDSVEQENEKLRRKYAMRRRAELLRRLLETLLLGSVGCIVCSGGQAAPLHVWRKELASHLCIVISTYILYPLRILCRQRSRFSVHNSPRGFFRIPASFDPAPLLYPIALPVLVALFLTSANPKVLVPNLVLSIASIPNYIIPFHDLFLGFPAIQWLLSTLPIAISRREMSNVTLINLDERGFFLDIMNAENATMLYPLHQALLPSLGYLTTTSLLRTELQLLSISMINLLVLSSSPQAIILKALLWIGGLSIFIFCGAVLKWEVALARIPRWRFRHPRRQSREGSVFLLAADDYFRGRLRGWGLITSNHKPSDDDESQITANYVPHQKKRLKLRLETRQPELVKNGPSMTKSISAVDDGERGENFKFPGRSSLLDPQMKRQRRHTLLSYVGSPPGESSLEKPRWTPQTSFSFGKPQSFLSLTDAQAVVVKWSYALYVYSFVFVAIALPIRTFVSQEALHGHEPVGWALGYLFGHLSFFRSVVINLHLKKWICLPPAVNSGLILHISSLDNLTSCLGAANIRLLICLHYLLVLGFGLVSVLRLTSLVEVDTRRKVFHGMMVAMFLPSILIDPAFAALALALALAIFLLLDLFRASQLPPLSRPLTHFLAPFVDGRDHRGPVIVSHIFLLIGCAIPLWLSLAAVERNGSPPWDGWGVPTRDVSMVSGVICVGMGDAAASLVGRCYGRHRWCWSGGKSLEGSLAFATAVVLGLCAAKLGLKSGTLDNSVDGSAWVLTVGKATVAAAGASLTEAVLTGGNDNVIVPIILWLLVKGLGI